MRGGRVSLLLAVVAVVALAALCSAAPSGEESYPQGPCEPGSEVAFQCNTCTCMRDGSGYKCSRQVCPPRQRRQARCVPGRPYPSPDGCNTCTCTSTRVLACTRRLCLDGGAGGGGPGRRPPFGG